MTPAGLALYRLASGLVSPLVPQLLDRRRRAGKEDGARLHERLGRPSEPRPKGPLVWLHGASVGEAVSLLPLVPALIARGFAVLMTTGTVTSAEIADRRLPEGALHQFVPVDTPGAARRFIAHWRPDLVLFAESEIWPNLIEAARQSGAGMAIINGRMSDRSLRRWQRLPKSIAHVLGGFDQCLAQSEEDAARYRALGAVAARSVGNLKFDVAPLPAEAAALDSLRATIGRRPVFIAASTHPGEEEIVVAAHLGARAVHPDLLTIVAPRHPQRGEPIAALARAAGLVTARRAGGEALTRDTGLYVADTIGELGLIYRLGGLAFLGGSFIAHGGQNPIEPAKLGVGVLHGPHVFNFTDVYAAFDDGGGAEALAGPDDLGPHVATLLAEPTGLAQMQDTARRIADGLGGALNRTLDALGPLMARALERGQ